MTSYAPILLDDGRIATVRPIAEDDTERLIAMHRRLSPTSVHRRFFAMLPELPPKQADRFTHVDGHDRAALVAVAPDGSLVAVARYDRNPDPTEAEMAIVVVDDWQRHGLGTELLRRLADYAREHGVDRFTADVLDENRPMFLALRDAGLGGAPCGRECGIDHMVLELHRPAASISGAPSPS